MSNWNEVPLFALDDFINKPIAVTDRNNELVILDRLEGADYSTFQDRKGKNKQGPLVLRFEQSEDFTVNPGNTRFWYKAEVESNE